MDALCPGEVHATGPERFGWKVFVETPTLTEAYGVLVAPASHLWRARILTYPGTLWTIPAGKGAMKFLGRSPQMAEDQAIRFIEEYCAVRRYVLRSGLELATSAPPPRLRLPIVPRPEAPRRWPLIVPVQYALSEILARAVTRNLSEGGVFVQTPLPPKSGAELKFEIVLHAEPVMLRGVVVWIRRNGELGRPPGMGIRLVLPPRGYLEYLRSLPPPKPAD